MWEKVAGKLATTKVGIATDLVQVVVQAAAYAVDESSAVG